MKENQPESEYIELKDILIDNKGDKDMNVNKEFEKDFLLLSSSKIEINDFISSEESDIIKADIELLKQMGYEQKLKNKVYIFLSTPNI